MTTHDKSPSAALGLSAEQAELAAALLQREGIAWTDAGHRIEPDPAQRHAPFPLTDVQQAYLLGRSPKFELGGVGSHGYQELDAVDLDLERYEDAWNRVIARHDMLRAVMLPNATQRILPEVPRFTIVVDDLRAQDTPAREAALAATRERMSHRVPDPQRWPMFEVRVSLLDAGRARIHFSSDALLIDIFSAAIIQDEIARHYEDPALELSPLSLSFRDFVLWLHAQRETAAFRASERYWQRKLAALPPAPELPLRGPLASLARTRFSRREHRIAPADADAIAIAARRLGITSSSLLLAVFSELLRRYGRRADLTLNVTVFERPALHPEMDRIAGDFTSTLLFQVPSAGESLGERARSVQAALLEDLEHRQVSGVSVLQQYAHRHQRAFAALMPVVFTSMLGLGEAGARLRRGRTLGVPGYMITQTPQALLDHQLYEESDGAFALVWDAVDEAFAPGVLDAMFESYVGLLQRLSDDAPALLGATRPVDLPKSQRQTRRVVNATEASESAALLHDGFMIHAERSPQREALVCGATRLSYGQLAARAGAVAQALREQGLSHGELVAVVMERGVEQPVAVLGILRAGGAYLPVDASLPQLRVEQILAQSGVVRVLTQERVRQRLSLPHALNVLSVDELAADREQNDVPDVAAHREQLAYVIYTSGSTGVPKGVAITHRAAVNTVVDINERFAASDTDRVLSVSSLSFDLSVYDLFGVLAAGGTLVLLESGRDKDPAYFWELMQRERITLWNSVPALLQLLLDYAETLPSGQATLPALRLSLLSGDWVPDDIGERLSRVASDARVVSLGGATEAAVWSIAHPIDGRRAGWASVPYGKPLRNQRWYVLDERMNDCPDWVIGELYIGGTGLAQGYFRDTERTAERFVTHPETGERLYRTGDLGRYREDGLIELLGREDHQVKVGGHRIELGEVESALGAHASVKECVVVAREGRGRGGKQLCAYVVQRRAAELTEDELRAHLSARLPDYMVPRAFVMLGALPLTDNGKVDRGRLPESEASAEQRPYVAPSSELERVIAEVMAGVLDLRRVGASDRYFDLGATSLHLARAHRLLQQRLGREIAVLDLFEHATVAQLATHLGTPAAETDPFAQAEERGALRRQLQHRARSAMPARSRGES